MEEKRRLIVGLGNPGMRYTDTRHNFGFMVLKACADKIGVTFKTESKFSGSLAKAKLGDLDLFLLLPTTYMNLSGEAVKKALSFFKILPQNMLVVCDDADIPFETLRLRAEGGSGGHNGLKSITEKLTSSSYPRLRMGIGKPTSGELESHVLERFSKEEEVQLPNICGRAIEIVTCWATEGMVKAQEKLVALS